MGAGRFVCVAVPFGLSLASLVCILIVMLAGVTNKSLDMFEIKTANLSISSSSLANLVDIAKRAPIPGDSLSALTVAGLSPNAGDNITAADLGLADSYKVSLWNYCATTGSKTNCTKAEFDWASSKLNTSTIEATATALTGTTVSLPSELKTALKTFKVFSKWTEVVYILAFFTCVAELFLGLFGFCSRAGSCLTFIISGLSTATIVIASILATVQSSLVIAAVRASARSYGVKGSLNTSYLATTWLAAAFSVGAGMFWMLTICCCAADHSGSSKRKSRGVDDHEKLIPTGAYQRVDDNTHFNQGYAGQQHGIYNPQQSTEYGVPMHNVKPMARGGNGAYEPYSHTAI
ncbi:hypothetical protein ONS95_010335 [Cadophora gregata]|uniref:uncharacterized protein n=1 Tax=Cadophora gregata TaxID=51156 RepID=UPI0026DAD3F8|nr:uncharacterized protein ONS95_010335 [Cadophora gregata]KAK0122071.1 hypothetical protein ONS95_010335 [Cadophora gregata]KAK0127546.1 hypothetical protein ONS96_007081 [Cadophora gregata f. sp. sojae]